MTTSASAPTSQRIDSAHKADRESHLDVSPMHGLVEDRQLFLAFADFISWDCRSVRFRMSSRIPPDYSSVPSGTQNKPRIDTQRKTTFISFTSGDFVSRKFVACFAGRDRLALVLIDVDLTVVVLERLRGSELDARERSRTHTDEFRSRLTRETYPPSSKFGLGTYAKGNRTHKF
ncbi:hypothetical protein G5I_12744 [Acromyrmex echinatior]|uniref:Uncharacterized protein n=1 Tax=Acromyrmex echinatior TaxID=103372 RepID=F4X353_ACREC|nr:hypothetical protein G5I_12744 [Acromyrmex echinatior]